MLSFVEQSKKYRAQEYQAPPEMYLVMTGLEYVALIIMFMPTCELLTSCGLLSDPMFYAKVTDAISSRAVCQSKQLFLHVGTIRR